VRARSWLRLQARRSFARSLGIRQTSWSSCGPSSRLSAIASPDNIQWLNDPQRLSWSSWQRPCIGNGTQCRLAH
jgi:hypothetical protein